MIGFDKDLLLKALEKLDKLVDEKITLIIGGGGAMISSYDFPITTDDVDSIIKNADIQELKPFIQQIAKELDLTPDWLNVWFGSFTYTLPSDYDTRLNIIFEGENVTAKTLGLEDLLILKCFAHRPKDISHGKALIKKGADLDFVENHIQDLAEKNIPGTEEALSFLDDLLEQLEKK